MSSLPDDADSLIRAARRIRHAASCADVASALLRAVVSGSPANAHEWRLRATVRTAAEGCLRRLELNLIMREGDTPGQRRDLRVSVRKALQRILRPVSGLDEVDLFRFSDMAVSGIATLSDATEAAVDQDAQQVCALLSLDGRLFIPARAAEFACSRGVSRQSLEALLLGAGRPLQMACRGTDASHPGYLRARRDHKEYGLSLRAVLEASSGTGPVIRVELSELDAPDLPPDDTAPTPDDSRFAARLLRAYVG
ncbi:MAG: hypothetical protein K8I27_05135 [Planctomycetes bacterium]|nr:hypothetical protein [Planctomycetota bacterium]